MVVREGHCVPHKHGTSSQKRDAGGAEAIAPQQTERIAPGVPRRSPWKLPALTGILHVRQEPMASTRGRRIKHDVARHVVKDGVSAKSRGPGTHLQVIADRP